jgi:hypothetical protein
MLGRLSTRCIIHKDCPLDTEWRIKLFGDSEKKYQVWKYDNHRSTMFKRYQYVMKELVQKAIGEEAFRYKTKGICKQEKKRTGRCGDCLDMDKLEKKKDDGKEFDEHEKADYSFLWRHKVCIIQSTISLSLAHLGFGGREKRFHILCT